MEKVTVEIGINRFSEDQRSTYVEWLADAFEMSKHRSQILINKLSNGVRSITVVVNYRQLARYTAKRATEEGMIKIWQYPRVIEHVEEQSLPPTLTIELRPEYRRK